jgi:hypothetical protein
MKVSLNEPATSTGWVLASLLLTHHENLRRDRSRLVMTQNKGDSKSSPSPTRIQADRRANILSAWMSCLSLAWMADNTAGG